MSILAKIFADDVRHLTSNIVSIIITIGLIVIPGLFTWFNVAACWDPFANTKNLQFAIANDDEGYKGDLLPMRINIGEQVVDTLRANSQLDWTFTKSSAEAIDGTKSGKYYAAVVIPKNFSKNMMTFFTDDAHHATLDYYNNEKLNALAPKVTGQGADTIAATINQTFSKTLTDTALNLASSMLDMLDKPEYQQRLKSFNGNMGTIKKLLSGNTATLSTALSTPVELKRVALFPVDTFGAALTPFSTFLPLWVGALLLVVTLKIGISRKRQRELGNPKPWQIFLGHYGVFAAIALLQSTFSCAGTLLFLRVQVVHPWLFMLVGWFSSIVYSFFTYTLVSTFSNVGKAIGVLFLVMQISGSNAAYPLSILPHFIGAISPWLPVSYSVTAMRGAIAGIYENDYWIAMGKLALFLVPLLFIGLVLRHALLGFNHWYEARVERTKLLG